MGIASPSPRKAQSAVEFTFLLVFVLFIATLVTVLLQQNLEREIERLDRQIVQEFRNVWYEEVQQAASATDGYNRFFDVQSNPRGFPVITRFGDSPNNVTDELIIEYKEFEFLFFLPTDVDYTGIGQNVSLSDGVRISRRCYDECQVFLYDDEEVAPGVNKTLLDSVETNLGSTNSLFGDWPLLYAAANAKFRIVNASDPSNMTFLANQSNSGGGGAQYNKPTSYKNTVAAPKKTAGGSVQLVNVSDPSNPNEIIDYQVNGNNPYEMVFDYPFGYVVSENDGLEVISLLNMSEPSSLSYTSTGGGVAAAYDNQGYVYAATNAPNLQVYDVIDRFNVSSETTISTSETTKDVAYRDNRLYVTMQGTLASYDVSDPTSASLLSNITKGIREGDEGMIWRDYWFVSDGDSGYEVIDVSDPTSIERVTNASIGSDVNGIHANHDALHLYFSNTTVASYR